MSEEKEPNEKRKKFLLKYFEYGLDSFKAHRDVYPECSEAVAKKEHTTLLNKLKKTRYYAEKIQEFQENLNKKAEKNRKKSEAKSQISFEWWTKQLTKIAAIGLGEIEIEKTNKEGKKYKMKHMDLRSASDALDKLAKAFLFYPSEKQKIEISGTGEGGKIEIVRKIIE